MIDKRVLDFVCERTGQVFLARDGDPVFVRNWTDAKNNSDHTENTMKWYLTWLVDEPSQAGYVLARIERLLLYGGKGGWRTNV